MVKIEKSTILAIDPGSRITGYAIFTGDQLKSFGHIKTPNKANKYEKIKYLATKIEEILNKFKPEEAILEEYFSFRRTKGSNVVPEVKGALFLVIHNKEITIHEINPRVVKKHMTGNGNARKEHIKIAVAGKYNIKEQPCSDTYDAIAIGDTYISNIGSEPT